MRGKDCLPLIAATVACTAGPAIDVPSEGEVAAAVTATEPPPVVALSAPVPVPSATPTPPLDWRAALAERAVGRGAVGRKTLLSWTTREQAEALVAGGPFLSREVSPSYGPSGFDWMIDAEVGKKNVLAALIFQKGFAKKRFAWPNAYATALGAGGGRYGAVLLKIDLADDALLVDWPKQRVVTIRDESVPLEELKAKPERLAAVYWEGVGYREYVLLNEAAIERVSFGTEEALAVFRKERDLLDQLVREAGRLSGNDLIDLELDFTRTLAFHSVSNLASIRQLASEANDVPPDGLSFSLVPQRSFKGEGPRPRLTAPRCTPKSSRDSSFRRQYCDPELRCARVAGSCEVIRYRMVDWDRP